MNFDFNKKGAVILRANHRTSKKTALYALFAGDGHSEEAAREFASSDEGAEFCSVEIFGEWSLKDGVTNELLSRAGQTEEEMIESWLASKIRLVRTDSSAYKKYCPACGVSGVYENGGIYSCPNCGTRYAFTEELPGESVIWICKLRRGL